MRLQESKKEHVDGLELDEAIKKSDDYNTSLKQRIELVEKAAKADAAARKIRAEGEAEALKIEADARDKDTKSIIQRQESLREQIALNQKWRRGENTVQLMQIPPASAAAQKPAFNFDGLL